MAQSSGDSIQNGDSDLRAVWEAFNKLRSTGQLCDAKVQAGGRHYPVHRAVLAANSSYFRTLFLDEEEKDRDFQQINVANVDPDVFEVILDYMYTRAARITVENVKTVLPSAEQLGVTGLVEQCSQFLESALSINNCVNILKFAQQRNQGDLASATKAYIRQSFVQVAERCKEFLLLGVQELMGFIRDDSLNVRQEEDVFSAVVRWIDADPVERSSHMAACLRTMRLGLLNTDYFMQRVAGHAYCLQHQDGCDPVISCAWDFHYGRETHASRTVNLADPLVRPRVPCDVVFVIGGWSSGAPIALVETYDNRADRWFCQHGVQDVTPRAYHGLVALNGLLYIVGGFDGAQYYNNVRCFNPLTREWRDVAPMYAQRCYVSTAMANGHIYALGGYDGRRRLRSAERYDPDSNQWTKIADMIHRRSDAGAESLTGKVLIVGGFNGDHCLIHGEMYSPDTDQWTQLPDMAWQRSGLGVTSYREHIYALGGFDGERRLCSGERYCCDTGRWEPIRDMYVPRSNFATFTLEGTAASGVNLWVCLSGERYCCDTGRWEPIRDMYVPRSNFATFTLEGRIYAVGGFNGTYTMRHAECFDVDTQEWYDVTDMNVNRSALKACVVRRLRSARHYTYHGHGVLD